MRGPEFKLPTKALLAIVAGTLFVSGCIRRPKSGITEEDLKVYGADSILVLKNPILSTLPTTNVRERCTIPAGTTVIVNKRNISDGVGGSFKVFEVSGLTSELGPCSGYVDWKTGVLVINFE